jgi:hypothetical protein
MATAQDMEAVRKAEQQVAAADGEFANIIGQAKFDPKSREIIPDSEIAVRAADYRNAVEEYKKQIDGIIERIQSNVAYRGTLTLSQIQYRIDTARERYNYWVNTAIPEFQFNATISGIRATRGALMAQYAAIQSNLSILLSTLVDSYTGGVIWSNFPLTASVVQWLTPMLSSAATFVQNLTLGAFAILNAILEVLKKIPKALDTGLSWLPWVVGIAVLGPLVLDVIRGYRQGGVDEALKSGSEGIRSGRERVIRGGKRAASMAAKAAVL